MEIQHLRSAKRDETGTRPSISGVELEWAREYERSLIPAEVRFPRKGDVYEALNDLRVSYVTDWAAPYSGGGEAIVYKGERIIVDVRPDGLKPVGVYAKPVNYLKVEERVVPEWERESPKYGGFHFYILTMELYEGFLLL